MSAGNMELVKEELSPCTVILTIRCSPEEVKAGYERAYRRAAKRVKVPGFRPGAAPASILRQYVDPEYLGRTATEEIVTKAYRAALREENIEPHGEPRIEVLKHDEETGEFEFKAKIPLPPKVALGPLEGIKVKRPKVMVTEAEIDEQVEELRRGRAMRKAVDTRGAKDGDYTHVVLRPEGEEGEGRKFMVVVGKTFPSLDEALRGMTLDDVKRAELTFPENFQESDWAGKTMAVDIGLSALTALELPELSKEFAQQFRAESVEALRDSIREGILGAKERFYESYVREQLLDGLVASSQIEAPDLMWERAAEARMRQIAAEAAEAGMDLATFAARNNMSVDELQARVAEEAAHFVRRALVVRKVFEEAGLELSRQDLGEELAVMAHEWQVKPEEAMAVLRRSGNLEELRFRVMQKKVLSYLAERAQIEETDA